MLKLAIQPSRKQFSSTEMPHFDKIRVADSYKLMITTIDYNKASFCVEFAVKVWSKVIGMIVGYGVD